jgi:hypothetical protein
MYEKGAKLKRLLGLQKRVFTSVMLGALVSAWIFSGTWGFSGKSKETYISVKRDLH